MIDYLGVSLADVRGYNVGISCTVLEYSLLQPKVFDKLIAFEDDISVRHLYSVSRIMEIVPNNLDTLIIIDGSMLRSEVPDRVMVIELTSEDAIGVQGTLPYMQYTDYKFLKALEEYCLATVDNSFSEGRMLLDIINRRKQLRLNLYD